MMRVEIETPRLDGLFKQKDAPEFETSKERKRRLRTAEIDAAILALPLKTRHFLYSSAYGLRNGDSSILHDDLNEDLVTGITPYDAKKRVQSIILGTEQSKFRLLKWYAQQGVPRSLTTNRAGDYCTMQERVITDLEGAFGRDSPVIRNTNVHLSCQFGELDTKRYARFLHERGTRSLLLVRGDGAHKQGKRTEAGLHEGADLVRLFTSTINPRLVRHNKEPFTLYAALDPYKFTKNSARGSEVDKMKRKYDNGARRVMTQPVTPGMNEHVEFYGNLLNGDTDERFPNSVKIIWGVYLFTSPQAVAYFRNDLRVPILSEVDDVVASANPEQAGLEFAAETVRWLRKKGVEWEDITLMGIHKGRNYRKICGLSGYQSDDGKLERIAA